jgi:hypothetical protein
MYKKIKEQHKERRQAEETHTRLKLGERGICTRRPNNMRDVTKAGGNVPGRLCRRGDFCSVMWPVRSWQWGRRNPLLPHSNLKEPPILSRVRLKTCAADNALSRAPLISGLAHRTGPQV